MDAELNNEATQGLQYIPDLEMLAAYRLLVHAELEYFLEQKAKDTLDAFEMAVKSGGAWQRDNPQVLSLCLAGRHTIEGKKSLSDDGIKKVALKVIREARDSIKNNHGIKSDSFTMLSLIAGKVWEEVDAQVSGMLQSFGSDRGDVAHQTIAKSTTITAPSAELNNVLNMITALGHYFDVH
ncbi:hypothetical protein I5T82_01260 [Stenotrophomonas maltophilia]|nr:hypothetical protein [Stenotrophomonas maltophilia]